MTQDNDSKLKKKNIAHELWWSDV